jgi:hypothetical protein
MMAELSVWNWIYFGIWLLLGLVIYFGFSRKNSKYCSGIEIDFLIPKPSRALDRRFFYYNFVFEFRTDVKVHK